MTISSLLTGIFLRQIPGHLIAGIRSGDLKVYGSIVRSVADGQIAGFLQETGGIAKVAGAAMTGSASLPGVGLAVDLAGHALVLRQGEQIKAAVATLQNLQLGALAVSGMGIGISLAGFAILSHKIGRVQAQLETLEDRVGALVRSVDALRHDRIGEDFVRLRTAAERMDEAWDLPGGDVQWRGVAKDAHDLQNAFQHRAREVLRLRGPGGLVTADPFTEALAVASSLRVAARLAAGDDVVARRAAREGAAALTELAGQTHVTQAVLSRLNETGVEAGTPGWAEALDREADRIRPVAGGTRARAAAAVSTVLTLDELDRRAIAGRDWLATAREETDTPLLYMPPTG